MTARKQRLLVMLRLKMPDVIPTMTLADGAVVPVLDLLISVAALDDGMLAPSAPIPNAFEDIAVVDPSSTPSAQIMMRR